MVKVLKLKGILPEDFRESHELCFYLHDRIADVVVIGEKFNLYEQEIIFRSEKDHEEFEAAVDTVKILNWLKERNYTDELNHIYLKQVYVALVSDLAHFIYEALIASAKGKNTVAFALLRKPLKDNLFMLENLLINKEHFHELFTDDQGFIKLVNDRVNETNKKELIDKVLNITELGFDKSFIYDARYNKKYIDGFEPIWQQANHLITTCPHYRTQTGNINFVFSNTENRFEQWRLLYSVLPKLLFYTFKIIMKIAIEDIGLEFVSRRGGDFRATLGILKKYGSKILSNVENIPSCDKCGNSINPAFIPMSIIINGKIRCQKCKMVLYK